VNWQSQTTASVRNAQKLPRGIRNHNPGNIEHSDRNKWQGLTDPPIEPEGRFARFSSATFGIRALAVLLITYQDRHNLHTVSQIIGRWAPQNENNTERYAITVAHALSRTVHDAVNLHDYFDLEPMVKAIIRHENGDPRPHGRSTWYSQEIIDEALRRAGVIKPAPRTVKETVVESPTIKAAGGTAAAGATVATVGGLELVRETKALVEPGTIAATVLGFIILGLAAYIGYRHFRKHRDRT
jgi:hypothetical protein